MRKELIDRRKLPPVWTEGSWQERREEIRTLLQREEYGFLPKEPATVRGEVLEVLDRFCAGHAALMSVKLHTRWEGGEYAYPIHIAIPKGEVRGVFIYISFEQRPVFDVQPVEEICDRGFALVRIHYEEVTTDDNDFTNGLAGAYYQGRARGREDPGKIALWAWSMMRAADYVQTLPELAGLPMATVGHSRLGKTALFAGMMDERFVCGFSNDSGCSGAALSRDTTGETVRDITRVFPFWFCPKYPAYADREDSMPFDQHFLLAAFAPRRVYVASAGEDSWADPVSEYLSAFAASSVYEKLGLCGLAAPERLPRVGDVFAEGRIGYHLRDGIHYLSRRDWNLYMDYMERIIREDGK